MHTCEICGRQVHKKIRLRGYTLCSKHMHQLFKYGKFLDNIPRTNNDKNDYVVNGNVATFHLYNKRNEYIGDFIVDATQAKYISTFKWRLSSGRVKTGYGNHQKDIAQVLMRPKKGEVVDHINSDALDNRLCNLRICTQMDNLHNLNCTKNGVFKGTWIDKRRTYRRFAAEIGCNHGKLFLGAYYDREQATYARYIAEVILFRKYRSTAYDNEKFAMFDQILVTDKFFIMQCVCDKILKRQFLISNSTVTP